MNEDKIRVGCWAWAIAVLIVAIALPARAYWLASHAARNVNQTAHDVIDKTINADNAIYNYEWFKTQYASYNSLGSKVIIAKKAVEDFKTLNGDVSKWKAEDKTEYSRLTAIVQGLESQMADVKAEYNAKSKMVNRSIFKDRNLPEEIK